jgi:hypothetical protein
MKRKILYPLVFISAFFIYFPKLQNDHKDHLPSYYPSPVAEGDTDRIHSWQETIEKVGVFLNLDSNIC